MSEQFGRVAQLVVGQAGGAGLDLSQLHLKFSIHQWDLQTPNTATVRVYNLAEATAQQIQKEFTAVNLQVGYEGSGLGLLFAGTIVQIRRGRENATDTYVDIVAADGDEATNFAIVNTAIAAGSTFRDRINALTAAMGLPQGHIADLPAATLPRGRTYYGMARDHLREASLGTDTKWSVQDAQIQLVPLGGFLPGEAVVLNSATGMIGLPEQAIDGIHVRCLINPKIKVGGRVQIDNKSVQQARLNLGVEGSAQNAFIPSIADDGFYRVVVAEHEGDTRGNDWYSNLICIAMNEAIPPALVARGYS